MKNVEKYSNEILDIYSSGHRVAVNKCTNEPVKCCISCITYFWLYEFLKNYLTFQTQSDILNNVRKILIIQLANTTPYRAVSTAPSTHKKYNRYSDTHVGEKNGGNV